MTPANAGDKRSIDFRLKILPASPIDFKPIPRNKSTTKDQNIEISMLTKQ